MQAPTPAGTARAEDPGRSEAKEAAEAVPAESVRRNGKQLFMLARYLNTFEEKLLISMCYEEG